MDLPSVTYYKYRISLTGSPITNIVITNYQLDQEFQGKQFPPLVWFKNVHGDLKLNRCLNGISDFWIYDRYILLDTLTVEELFAEIL